MREIIRIVLSPLSHQTQLLLLGNITKPLQKKKQSAGTVFLPATLAELQKALQHEKKKREIQVILHDIKRNCINKKKLIRDPQIGLRIFSQSNKFNEI